MEKFPRPDGLERSRTRKGGVLGLVKTYFQNDNVLELIKNNVPNLQECSTVPVDFMIRFSADGANISPFTSVCTGFSCAFPYL